jgi:hypothetical protein
MAGGIAQKAPFARFMRAPRRRATRQVRDRMLR